MSSNNLPSETVVKQIVSDLNESMAHLRDVIEAYSYVATEPDAVEVARAFLHRMGADIE